MINLGNDILKGATVRIPFNTNAATGASITIGTNGTPYAIVDGSTTEVTTGVSLSEDFDSRTGTHFIAVDTSQSGFPVGAEVLIGIHTNTIDGISPVNAFVGRFGIQMANSTKPIVGLAQGGSTGYVDLPTSAPSVDGELENCIVTIKHIATGFRESRFQSTVTAYVGASRRLTVSPPFSETAAASDEVEVYLGVPAATDSFPDVNFKSADSNVITAAALATDAVTEIQSGLATASALSTLSTNVDTIDNLLDTEMPALTSAVAGLPTSTRNAILNWEMFTGFSLAKMFRVFGIVLFGTKTGSGTATEIFTAPADGATVTATVDVDANRSAVITDASGTP